MAVKEHLRRLIPYRKFIRGLLLLLFIGAVIFGITVVAKLDDGVQKIQTAEQSDPLWVASQLQFEVLRLENALGEYALGSKTAIDVVLRFEIAWSRINILQRGDLPQLIESFQVDSDVVSDLEATFIRLEPVIQGLNTDSLTGVDRSETVEAILFELEGFDLSIRKFLVTLSQAKSQAMGEFRSGLLTLSDTVAYLSATILGLLGIFVFSLMLELRASKDAENEMRQLAEEATSAARMKMNFMSIVSHELRTPLTSIIGGLALLKRRVADTMKDEVTLKLIDVASRNGDRLLALVNDILDAQALAEGKVKADLKPVDLNAVVSSAVEGCQAYGDKHNVSYLVETPNEKLKTLTDSARVSQVLANLISNATKFTTPGDVVKIRLKKMGQKARIEVTDNGIGIPIAAQTAIFSPFHQVNPGTTGATQSSGLGLSITKQLIDLLGGEIGFKSFEGKGSTFWIELDLLPNTPETQARA
ncbi:MULTISPECIES: sensor histidine kinase [Sulfitobacter]|uniref:sensor histidine kinase n=1 Tax=Sulfitobacter TaxID=60136 RepID=UPI00104DDA46|nr:MULTISPECIES: HAMP domain-containing sensor histidine kinase [Sulfitobacter]UWR38778.1 HAMP domain-containing histidine kinase [Sulfitobacter sp. W074]